MGVRSLIGSLKLVVLVCMVSLVVACAGKREEELLQQADQYVRQGDLNAAVIQLRSILQSNANSAQARLMLGRVYLAQYELLSAEKELRKAGELDKLLAGYLPELAEVYLRLGKNDDLQALVPNDALTKADQAHLLATQGLGNLFIIGDSEVAARQIDEALALSPESLDSQVAKAHLSLARREVDFARQEVGEILQVAPDFAPAWSLLGDIEKYAGDNAAAEKAYSRVIALPGTPAKDILKRAEVRIHLDDFDGAQADIGRVKQLFPNNASVNFTQGLIYFGQGALGEASQSFLSVLASDERHLNALYYSAAINLQLGNLNLALENARRLQAIVPDLPIARKLLAAVLVQTGDLSSASELLAPLTGPVSTDQQALSIQVSALRKQGLEADSVALLRRITELQPDSTDARLQLAAGLLETGEEIEANRLLEQLMVAEPKSERAYQRLVIYHLKRGELERAQSVAQRLRRADPENLAGMQLLANVYMASGDHQSAIDMLETIQVRSPGDAVANYSLAELAIVRKDFTQAHAYYERVLARKPDDLDALLRLVRLYAVEQKPQEMVSTLQRAVDAHKDALAPRLMLARFYYITGESDKSLPLLSKLDSVQSNHPDVLELRALVELAEGQYAEAKRTLYQRVKQKPDSAFIQFLLAKTHAALEDNKATLRYLATATQLAPENVVFGISYARALAREEEFENAATELDRLAQQYPDNVTIKKLRSVVTQQHGDAKGASTLLGEIFASEPSTTNLLAVVGQLWNQGDKKSAIELQEKWLSENPDDQLAAQTLAGAYGLQGKKDLAVSGFERLLEKDKNNVVALNQLAWLLKEGQPERALAYSERATELAPKSPAILDTLAVVLYHNGNYRKARQVMQEALALLPGHPSLRYHEAMIDAALGDKERAIGNLRSLVSTTDIEFKEKAEAELLLAKLQP